jgi:hypothetical protein
MNSWDPKLWGQNGFGWIDYDTLDALATIKGLYRAYILTPVRHTQ